MAHPRHKGRTGIQSLFPHFYFPTTPETLAETGFKDQRIPEPVERPRVSWLRVLW